MTKYFFKCKQEPICYLQFFVPRNVKGLDRVPGQIKGGERSFQRGVVFEDVVDRRRSRPRNHTDRPTQIHVHPDEAPESLSFLVLLTNKNRRPF